MLENLRKELLELADPGKAKILSGFFKTGKGQYGEGDVFYGINVPQSRKIVRKYYKELSLDDIKTLLESNVHEERFVGAMILVIRYEKGNSQEKEKIYSFYMKNRYRINNWDLVDLSAPNIVGDYLLDKDRNILYDFARSDILWERRIAVLATAAFIRKHDFEDILNLAKLLLDDKHDLMHKAVGWMLREVGKRNPSVLEGFLDENVKRMPRTMLRYSIEKFSTEKRKDYLSR